MNGRRKTHKSTGQILTRMAVALLIIVGVGAWQHDYLADLYFRNQATQVGWYVNGAILLLFLSGLTRLIQLFMLYGREEEMIDRFTASFEPEAGEAGTAPGVPSTSIIGQRYNTIVDFYRARTEINHNALAATLLAEESSRTSFPKFVNNVLILTGVFGTIVSLTVALLGASSFISETQNVDGINMVIHGMSTALSTTMTAIFAYFFFAYFYLKLLDTQSHILGRVEHVSATLLIPRFQIATRSPEQNLNDLLVSMSEGLKGFEDSLKSLDQMNTRQNELFEQVTRVMDQNHTVLNNIRDLLRDGFRLHDDDDKQ